MGLRRGALEAVGMSGARPDPVFWAGRRVLVTGHTGFKGAWLCLLLNHLGAHVSGVALPAESGGAFDAMRPIVESYSVNVTDAEAVAHAVRRARPEIVLHLAAQALVGRGWEHPLETFATNVMGTAHLLETLIDSPAAVALVVTSDKVYRGNSTGEAFDEDSPLSGSDPYSASKVATEQVAAAWRERLLATGCQVATARAGNVLGGGDFGAGRLAPDVIRAHRAGETVILRRPDAVRPWQYVLDVLGGYLLYAQSMFGGNAPESLNFGPDANAAVTVADLVTLMQRALGGLGGWRPGPQPFKETTTLRLDSSRALQTLGWRATTDIGRALELTAAWHQAVWREADGRRMGRCQIDAWWDA
jgi:CDP-glucose 4,6-dehydratase